MQASRLLLTIASEKEKFNISDEIDQNLSISKFQSYEQQTFAKRAIIDNYRLTLNKWSQMDADKIQKIEPGKLIQMMKYCIELVEKGYATKLEETYIFRIFKTFRNAITNNTIEITQEPQNSFFQKMLMHGYDASQLFAGNWKFQQVISPDLKNCVKKLREFKDKGVENSKKEQELILAVNYERGKLHKQMHGDCCLPVGSGLNGTLFWQSFESNTPKAAALFPGDQPGVAFLGVFKPHPKTIQDSANWCNLQQAMERAKTVVGMESYLNSKDANKRVNNEIFAYELFHIFGFQNYHIQFPTTLKVTNENDPNKRPASFGAFIPNFDLVEKHIKSDEEKRTTNLLNENRNYTEQELSFWILSKLFDYLTGNLDGHAGNAGVIMKDGYVVGTVNFDYDKAFATQRVENMHNQYAWADLKISQKIFPQCVIDSLKKILENSEEKIREFLKVARENDQQPDNFTENQENLLKYRLGVLHQIVEGKILRLSDIKKYK